MEVDTTDLLEKDTTMQENINEILLNTETPRSFSIGNTETPISSSIGIQTLIASSSRGTQTSLSLSARSPRKVHLHREIQKYKKQITALELTRHEEKKEDMSILFQQLDKFCPKEMSDFMKQQARLL